MMKRLASAAVLGLLMTGAALAQSSPTETQTAQPAAPAAQEQSQAPAAPAAPAPAPQAQANTADSAPATQEACIATAASLGTTAEGKTLAEDKLDQLDQLFTRMESLCDGKQFAEAMAVAKDIKTMLDVN